MVEEEAVKVLAGKKPFCFSQTPDVILVRRMRSCLRSSRFTHCLACPYILVLLLNKLSLLVLFGVFYYQEPFFSFTVFSTCFSSFSSFVMDNVQPQQPQQDPTQQLINIIGALNQRIQQLEAQQPAPAAQAQQQQQQQQQHSGENNNNRSIASDFGYTPEQVITSWRELSDRIRAVPIPSSAGVNTTKTRGASTATKAELDNIARVAPVARTLLQLYNLSRREQVPAEHLAEACLILGLHLTSILQQRQGDLFVESAFPDAFDTFRQLRAGPGGSLAGEELQRLTTAIQLSSQTARRPGNNSNSPRGNYNNYNNTSRGGHRGGGGQGYNNNNTRGGFGHYSNYNNYNNQRGGYNGPDRGGDQ